MMMMIDDHGDDDDEDDLYVRTLYYLNKDQILK